MDPNKLTKLKEIDYAVRRVYGNCEYIVQPDSRNGFSTCIMYRYNHQKHTNTKRNLSVSLHGHCDKHKWRSNSDSVLGSFADLKED